MITAIVRFKLPAGTTSDKATEMYRASSKKYENLPGLVRKYYLFDPKTGEAGGVYLWESRAAADAVYTPAWKADLTRRYGMEPQVSYFDSPVIVDNTGTKRAAAE
jgi:hypothetical protein